MKKLIVLFGILTLIPSLSYAKMYEDETTDLNILKKQGFSTETLKIVDQVRYQDSDSDSTYTRQFTPKKGKHKLGRAYTKVKLYFDPMQDDGKFGEHEINYANIWRYMEDAPGYSSAKENKNFAEDL